MSDAAIVDARPATVRATRYVAPLREGGSLPGLVEADDDGLYVLKFRGAGQGVKSLVAEVVVARLAVAVGLPVPEIAFADVDPALGRAEPDPEIQELIGASRGLNFGIDFLPGALPFEPGVPPFPDPSLAAAVVWLDAFVMNVDRTPRNPNLLVWHSQLYLIDHGAALYVHHEPGPLVRHASRPFAAIADHVLLPFASSIADAHVRVAPLLTDSVIGDAVAAVPDEWLAESHPREEYAAFLASRLAAAEGWVEEAERARER